MLEWLPRVNQAKTGWCLYWSIKASFSQTSRMQSSCDCCCNYMPNCSQLLKKCSKAPRAHTCPHRHPRTPHALSQQSSKHAVIHDLFCIVVNYSPRYLGDTCVTIHGELDQFGMRLHGVIKPGCMHKSKVYKQQKYKSLTHIYLISGYCCNYWLHIMDIAF